MTDARERRPSAGATVPTRSRTKSAPGPAFADGADPLYRLIAENARDVVVQMDRDARILYASPSIRVMGYSLEEVIGRRGPEFVHPDDLQRLLDNTANVLRGGQSDVAQDRRYRFRRKDG